MTETHDVNPNPDAQPERLPSAPDPRADPRLATGADLDVLAQRADVPPRVQGEPDAAFRARLLADDRVRGRSFPVEHAAERLPDGWRWGETDASDAVRAYRDHVDGGYCRFDADLGLSESKPAPGVRAAVKARARRLGLLTSEPAAVPGVWSASDEWKAKAIAAEKRTEAHRVEISRLTDTIQRLRGEVALLQDRCGLLESTADHHREQAREARRERDQAVAEVGKALA